MGFNIPLRPYCRKFALPEHIPFHMIKALFSTLLIGSFLASEAQNVQLPPEWGYSADGHQLIIGKAPVQGLYQKDVLRTIDLQFTQPDWWEQLVANEATNTRIPVKVIVDGIEYDSVGVRFKGSVDQDTILKRAFSLDFNHYIAGQNIMGYSTLNLDNAENDPSFLREVLYSDLIRKYIPTPKANFIHLNINGEDWGLYPNVQQINSPFLQEWYFSNNGSLWSAERPDGQQIGTFGDGTAALNWLGPDPLAYQEFYELERTEQIDPWNDLVNTIDKLNNTPLAQLEDTLNKYMDLDRVLWFLACENVFGDRDSYIRKGKDDYMIYHVAESDRTEPVQIDGRDAFRTSSVTWTPFYHADDANYPLLNRLLSVPALRQRYLAHMRTIIATDLQTPVFNALLAEYASMIDAEVQADTKKFFTYGQFQNEQIALQEFVNARRITLNANFEIAQIAPQITGGQHSVNGNAWADPLMDETVNVRATVSSGDGITAVYVHYSFGLTAPFARSVMYDDGAHDDGSAGDGIYGVTLPTAPLNAYVRYYFEAVSANNWGTVSFDPPGAEHDVYVFRVQYPTVSDPPVRINEVLAANTSTNTDDLLEYDDWIELYNNSDQPIDLSEYWLSDNGANLQKWQFPLGSTIAPFGFFIIWADGQNDQGSDHANFSLSASGESVWLSTPDGMVMDALEFGPQTDDIALARRPNGIGPFEFQEPTFNLNNDLVSIEEITARPAVRFHPNPARDQLILVTDGPEEVVIYDATLRNVYAGMINGRSQIDVGRWAAGTYWIRNGSQVQKLIVIR